MMLIDIKPGDEVILPSFTYVSSANSIALRGGVPVFVDIDPRTKTIDIERVSSAITSKTKAIMPVHYAGVSCDMNNLIQLARDRDLYIVEDAAQSFGAEYLGVSQGHLSDIGCISFHKTKNIHCFSGGAIAVNLSRFDALQVERLYSCGTDRSSFHRGEVSRYTWQGLGSNFEGNEISAAFLYAQLLSANLCLEERLSLWNLYHSSFHAYELSGKVLRPYIPPYCKHNAHIYYLSFDSLEIASRFIEYMKGEGVQCCSHYTPLHLSPAASKLSRVHGDMSVTEKVCSTLVRLPLWPGMGDSHDYVISATCKWLDSL
jgi:dTDP-4-amino-4,6-dideoxygalactose transaminase